MIDGSTVVLLLRTAVSLAVVLGVIVFAARLLAGRGALTSRARFDVPVQLIRRQGLSRRSSVSVVQVGDEILVLGVTDAEVTLLSTLDPADYEVTATARMPEPSRRAGLVPGDGSADTVLLDQPRAEQPHADQPPADVLTAPAAQPATGRDFASVLRHTVALPMRRDIKRQGEQARTLSDLVVRQPEGRHRDQA